MKRIFTLIELLLVIAIIAITTSSSIKVKIHFFIFPSVINHVWFVGHKGYGSNLMLCLLTRPDAVRSQLWSTEPEGLAPAERE